MEAQARPTEWTKYLRLMFGLIYIAILIIGAVLFLPDYWYLWLIILIVILMRFMSWLSKKQVYECNRCKTRFFWEKRRFTLVPKAADLYGKEAGIKCPKCGSTNITLIDAKKKAE
jgi:DNA-directed RNA polymerase subunit RPC12/RpoP